LVCGALLAWRATLDNPGNGGAEAADTGVLPCDTGDSTH
jgi:hypothetical protein